VLCGSSSFFEECEWNCDAKGYYDGVDLLWIEESRISIFSLWYVKGKPVVRFENCVDRVEIPQCHISRPTKRYIMAQILAFLVG
jgi:hypothetical protein